MPVSERRRGPRIVPGGSSWVAHRGNFMRTRLVNMSATGALIEGISEDIPVGTTVRVRCALGEGLPELEGDAIVRGHRPGGLIAVEFAWAEPDQRRLSEIIDTRAGSDPG